MALKQLGQSRPPAIDTPVEIYKPASGRAAALLVVTIANTSGSATTYRLFQNASSTSPTEPTAIAWDVAILADETNKVSIGPMNDTNARLWVSSKVALALTFTLHGSESLVT